RKVCPTVSTGAAAATRAGSGRPARPNATARESVHRMRETRIGSLVLRLLDGGHGARSPRPARRRSQRIAGKRPGLQAVLTVTTRAGPSATSCPSSPHLPYGFPAAG